MSVNFDQRLAFKGTAQENAQNGSSPGAIIKGAALGAGGAALITKIIKPTGGIDPTALSEAGITKDSVHLSTKIANFSKTNKNNLTNSAKDTVKTVRIQLAKAYKQAKTLGANAPEAIAKAKEDAINTLQNGTKKIKKNTIIGAAVGALALLVIHLIKGKKDPNPAAENLKPIS